ncbi:F0F1 ATP synthase subunit delta [Francisella philomiragia]|uniref:ATP synthase subunit delta n=2 Tax=Francisella philomiragia TaxID=28110 RepID=ATPD_FRAP2|nr:F0F1 ATP synthase subunit delta [Francisella philomiragia]B0TWS4.1 RecName: Full=ATP synthase subunit delta; AltName: Full=ATP synthase F(1) sector subunit delta; AltName: Full=F-type ATPase subunit delta; Short=F-ATPase subunit delta [Francisella philomiragia subsp. philomiragia ATCC 25017]AJI48179.1 ATP synthase F1, delta subunit [Francisella philomiragia]AJI48983.1 ATP synthase F1, delta subunit [Francisella philomiragia]AJI56298.1 ATP synthase F1, delta subunit [Francisella philomiragia]
MTNLSVIAKPYAKAAFEFANEYNLLQEWSKQLKSFAELVQDDAIAAIISSPEISQTEIINTVKDQLDEKFFNFVALVAENKKLSILPEISFQFENIRNVHNNIKVADVTLAYAIDKNTLANLKTKLEEKFSCSIDMNVIIDPVILGGAVIKVGDTVIDDSVSGRIETLKSILLS